MTMSDQQVSDLFAEGTAPERDPAFVLEVAAGIARARLRIRLLTIAYRMTVVLSLSGAIFVAGRLIEPVLTGLPQFMGVPVPLVLGVLALGLVLRGRRWLVPLERVVSLHP